MNTTTKVNRIIKHNKASNPEAIVKMELAIKKYGQLKPSKKKIDLPLSGVANRKYRFNVM